jgi:DNA modification methylase
MNIKWVDLNKRTRVIHADCIECMQRTRPDFVSAIVTDAPYGLGFMNQHWDEFTPQTFQQFCNNWGTEALRILKPGGHLLCFSGTRTYHRLVCGLEDAGFEIRDTIAWVYGSGFPKSQNIAKTIDKMERGHPQGAPDPQSKHHGKWKHTNTQAGAGFSRWIDKAKGYEYSKVNKDQQQIYSNMANAYTGWGTALKPAMELIVIARKPMAEKTIVSNVLKYGTGAINIDTCRVNYNNDLSNPATNPLYRLNNGYKIPTASDKGSHSWSMKPKGNPNATANNLGRWPANIIHDGSNEVIELFPVVKSGAAVNMAKAKSATGDRGIYGHYDRADFQNHQDGGIGSAARFFYCAKVAQKERNIGGVSNTHPTVKPIALMEYLLKLVTPPDGIILDPFMGSGSTGCAAAKLGFKFIGIEKELDYAKISLGRIKYFTQILLNA